MAFRNPPLARRCALVIAACAAGIAVAAAPGLAAVGNESTPLDPTTVLSTPPNPMTILYVSDAGAKAIFSGANRGDATVPMQTLPWVFRQEPSSSAGGAALASNDRRMTKVSGRALFRQTSSADMFEMLRAAVEKECVTPAGVNTCGAHRVGVDEIGTEWGDLPGAAQIGASKSRMLRVALQSLELFLRPDGGTYADRIDLYIAPGVSTAIEKGLGPNRTLGRDRKPHFRNYTELAKALPYAGGIWLEMYHYPTRGKPRESFTVAEWGQVPMDVAAFIRSKAPGSRPSERMHFVMTQTKKNPCGRITISDPTVGGAESMDCQWTLAKMNKFNRKVLANGPAAYKVSGAMAVAWGMNFHREFTNQG